MAAVAVTWGIGKDWARRSREELQPRKLEGVKSRLGPNFRETRSITNTSSIHPKSKITCCLGEPDIPMLAIAGQQIGTANPLKFA